MMLAYQSSACSYSLRGVHEAFIQMIASEWFFWTLTGIFWVFNMFVYCIHPSSGVYTSFYGNACFPQASNNYLAADVKFYIVGEYYPINKLFFSIHIWSYVFSVPKLIQSYSPSHLIQQPQDLIPYILSQRLPVNTYLWPHDVICWPYILIWRSGMEVRVYPQRNSIIKGRSF